MVGPVEADPEYQLIVQVNQMAAEFDTEIGQWCTAAGRVRSDRAVIGTLSYRDLVPLSDSACRQTCARFVLNQINSDVQI